MKCRVQNTRILTPKEFMEQILDLMHLSNLNYDVPQDVAY